MYSEANQNNLEFERITDDFGSKILVIGVGGGGNNAVTRMMEAGVNARFVAVNTDTQVLALSKAKKVQIGKQATKGLGAGANPEVGQISAEESRNELESLLDGVELLFITAGMGGGTGTGAAPIIAKIGREKGILTVAVVTKPFPFEGGKRKINAEHGIEELRKYVDTLVIIPNEKLLEVLPPTATMLDAFKEADDVLRMGIQGISDLITTPSMINLDFADIRTVMKDTGLAHMGVGEGHGETKTLEAVQMAVRSPLLETNISGATGVILNITGGYDLTLEEVDKASQLIHKVVDENANIIFGTGIDPSFENKVTVTLIATGFQNSKEKEVEVKSVETQIEEAPLNNNEYFTEKVVEQPAENVNTIKNRFADKNVPAFIRNLHKDK